MKRNFKSGRGGAIALKTYLSRRGITLEDVIKSRNLKTVIDVRQFLISINVIVPQDKYITKLLKKKSMHVQKPTEDMITTEQNPKAKISKRTRSKKLTNIVDNAVTLHSSETDVE